MNEWKRPNAGRLHRIVANRRAVQVAVGVDVPIPAVEDLILTEK
jgi:hypothetical protein